MTLARETAAIKLKQKVGLKEKPGDLLNTQIMNDTHYNHLLTNWRAEKKQAQPLVNQ